MPRFSVVVPLFNKEQYIERTIDSVLTQTMEDFELIVVDDGSTDRSIELVKRYGDKRIRCVKQGNQGVSEARNRGVAESSGDVIGFLDADDTWSVDFLETISTLMVKYPLAGLYASKYQIIDLSGTTKLPRCAGIPKGTWDGILPNYVHSLAYGNNPLCSSSVCIPKKVLKEVGGFLSGVRYHEDTEMWIRISLKYPVAFSTRICSTYYRDVESSAIHNYVPEDWKLPFQVLLLNSLKDERCSAVSEDDVRELFAKYKIMLAKHLLLARKVSSARELIRGIQSSRFIMKLKKRYLLCVTFLPRSLSKWIGFKQWNIQKRV